MVRLIFLLALLTAFPPLATDMYLPAIPFLEGLWNVPLALINLTLVLFFATYCLCLLFYGPLSDRFGRKPPLIAGIILYTAASFACAVTNGVVMLILARIFQAAGAAAASAISLAIAKDRLDARNREVALGYIAVIMTLAPMISPMIGSLIMTWLTWQWIFVAQGGMGIVALVSVIMTTESNPNPSVVEVAALVKSYGRVLANGRFMGVVGCASLVGVPHFAFIAGSSSMYITDFHMSENTFALFFGANALCLMMGSLVCARLSHRMGTLRMMTIGFVGMVAGGILMASGLIPGPWGLALPMGLISFTGGLSRPPSNNLALEQVERDTGTASSAMIFTYFIVGALSMAAISLDWPDKVRYLALSAVGSGVVSLGFWLWIKKYIRIPYRNDGS